MQLARRVLLCAAVLGVLAAGTPAASAHPRPAVRAWRHAGLSGYEWHPADRLTASQARSRLRFLDRRGFDNVYIDLGDYIDAYERWDEGRLAELQGHLSRYVAYASRLGLTVHGVGGGPDWTDEATRRYLGPLLVELVADYNARVGAAERLGGVHFDIEPYTNPAFFDDLEASLTDYLETVQDIVVAYRWWATGPANRQLQLGFAIPFWFDAGRDAPGPVYFNGRTKAAAFHVIDMVWDLRRAYLVVMSYRNLARGSDGSIFHARREFIYAGLVRARSGLVVGQQFSAVESADLAKTTFHGRGRRAFERAAEQIVRAFGHYPQFRGLSVDDLDAYMAER
jgi:hypothetical protein